MALTKTRLLKHDFPVHGKLEDVNGEKLTVEKWWIFQGHANHEVQTVNWNTGIFEVKSA